MELKCPQHRRWPSVIFRINADTRQHQSFVDTLSQSGPITNIVSQWQHHNIQLHTTLEHSVAKGYCSIYLGPVVRWPGVKYVLCKVDWLAKDPIFFPDCTDELEVEASNSAANYLGPEYHGKFVMRAEN